MRAVLRHRRDDLPPIHRPREGGRIGGRLARYALDLVESNFFRLFEAGWERRGFGKTV